MFILALLLQAVDVSLNWVYTAMGVFIGTLACEAAI